MARSIDPRRETLRGTQGQNDTAALFGTRVAEPILVSGQRDRTQNRPDIWSQAIRAINRSSFLQAGGRPHMQAGGRVPACAGMTIADSAAAFPALAGHANLARSQQQTQERPMIELYGMGSPNVVKIFIALEELE